MTPERRSDVALAALALVAGGSYVAWWTSLARAGRFQPVDFDAFYTGAAIVRDGLGARLYDLRLQAAYQAALLGFLPLRGGPLPFVSPPSVAVALLPLAALPIDAAHRVWSVLQLALAAALGRGAWRAAGERPGERALGLAATLAFPMLFVTLYKGQVTLLVLLALLGWWRGLRRGDDRASGLCLVAFAVKPQLFLAPLLVTALRRRGRALAWFAAGSAVVALGTVAVVGVGPWRDFLAVTRALEVTYDYQLVYPAHMYNFRGFLALLGVAPPLTITLTRVGLAAALAVVALLWVREPPTAPLDDRRVAASLLLTVFFTPHLYFYDTLLLLAVAAPFHAWLRASRPAGARALLLAALVVPALFLETAWVPVGSGGVRVAPVLMALWGGWIARELMRPAPAAAA